MRSTIYPGRAFFSQTCWDRLFLLLLLVALPLGRAFGQLNGKMHLIFWPGIAKKGLHLPRSTSIGPRTSGSECCGKMGLKSTYLGWMGLVG